MTKWCHAQDHRKLPYNFIEEKEIETAKPLFFGNKKLDEQEREYLFNPVPHAPPSKNLTRARTICERPSASSSTTLYIPKILCHIKFWPQLLSLLRPAIYLQHGIKSPVALADNYRFLALLDQEGGVYLDCDMQTKTHHAGHHPYFLNYWKKWIRQDPIPFAPLTTDQMSMGDPSQKEERLGCNGVLVCGPSYTDKLKTLMIESMVIQAFISSLNAHEWIQCRFDDHPSRILFIRIHDAINRLNESIEQGHISYDSFLKRYERMYREQKGVWEKVTHPQTGQYAESAPFCRQFSEMARHGFNVPTVIHSKKGFFFIQPKSSRLTCLELLSPWFWIRRSEDISFIQTLPRHKFYTDSSFFISLVPESTLQHPHLCRGHQITPST